MTAFGTLAVGMFAASGTTLAEGADAGAARYCSELKQVVALATTSERFTSITGQPREGNFLDTSFPLTGWNNCSLYGRGTYTCDSRQLKTAEEVEAAQASTLHQIKACLGEGWSEAADRSSAGYVVLHHAVHPVSITLSRDQTDDKKHVVRLIVFVRRN